MISQLSNSDKRVLIIAFQNKVPKEEEKIPKHSCTHCLFGITTIQFMSSVLCTCLPSRMEGFIRTFQKKIVF